MDIELAQGGWELGARKNVGKMAAGNLGGDFFKMGKWNSPKSDTELNNATHTIK